MESQIDKYIIGALEGKDLETFQNQLKTNAMLQKEVLARRKIVEALDQLQADELKAKFKQFEQQKNKQTIVYFPLRKIIAIAASILLLLGVGWWFYGNSTTSTTNLFTTNYKTPKWEHVILPSTKRDDITSNVSLNEKNWEEAEKAFKAEKFDVALVRLEAINLVATDTIPPLDDYLFIKGITYLENKEFEKALIIFNDSQTGGKRIKAWYAALTLLQLNRPKSDLIAAFSKVEGPYQKQANDILEQLSGK